MKHAQVSGASEGITDRRDRGNEAARENVLFNEVHGPSSTFIELISNGNALEQHHAVRFEQITEAPEKSIEMVETNSFDHLNRHELVVLSTQVTIVVK